MRKAIFNYAAVGILLISFVGCSQTNKSTTMCRTELYFGMSKPDGGQISDTEWKDFVDREVTPRFKEGLTVIQGYGQWQEPSGTILKEKTCILILIYPNSQDLQPKVDQIICIYKKKFNQNSVLKVTCEVKASF